MKTRIRQLTISFIELTVGAIVAAFAIEEFLVPNHIFDGGVTGISMIVAHFIPLPLWNTDIFHQSAIYADRI